MNTEIKQEIIKFATPPVSVAVTGSVFAAISPILYFIVKAVSPDPLKSIVTGCVTAFMGVVFVLLRFYYRAMAQKAIKDSEAKADTAFLEKDFRTGRRFLGDRIICGSHYLMGKGLGVIIRLYDVDKIYREIKSYRGVPVSENLTAVMKNRKKITICSVSVVEGANPPFSEVINEISKNVPDIEFCDRRIW